MPATETTTMILEPGSSQVLTERLLHAPAAKVYAAMLDPELVAQWWGPRRYETIVEQLEPKRGGRWRFFNKDADGNEFGFNGVIHELIPNERITQTFEFEGTPGHVVLEQMTLVAEGENTRLLGRSAFLSVEDRDGMVDAGMEGGLRESHDRLQELLDRM